MSKSYNIYLGKRILEKMAQIWLEEEVEVTEERIP